jgi:hypothetical protein
MGPRVLLHLCAPIQDGGLEKVIQSKHPKWALTDVAMVVSALKGNFGDYNKIDKLQWVDKSLPGRALV